jgi:hypothetical protein
MRDHHDQGGGHDQSSHHRMMIRDFRGRFFASLGLPPLFWRFRLPSRESSATPCLFPSAATYC